MASGGGTPGTEDHFWRATKVEKSSQKWDLCTRGRVSSTPTVLYVINRPYVLTAVILPQKANANERPSAPRGPPGLVVSMQALESLEYLLGFSACGTLEPFGVREPPRLPTRPDSRECARQKGLAASRDSASSDSGDTDADPLQSAARQLKTFAAKLVETDCDSSHSSESKSVRFDGDEKVRKGIPAQCDATPPRLGSPHTGLARRSPAGPMCGPAPCIHALSLQPCSPATCPACTLHGETLPL